jgi:hypothetical protein
LRVSSASGYQFTGSRFHSAISMAAMAGTGHLDFGGDIYHAW